jgi:chemotaxis protein MotB
MLTFSTRLKRPLLLALAAAACTATSGCCCGRRREIRQAKLRSMQLYQQCQQLGGQLQSANQLAADKQKYEQLANQLQSNLDTANQRIANLTNERGSIQDQYKNMLTGLRPSDNPLNSAANRKFEELARKYPEFEFDPTTGVSRFNGDLLFASGSDEIQQKGLKVLQEFSRIMNEGDAKQFHVLVVGHTDDTEIVKPTTRANHPTNWDLSAHRATSVVKAMAKMGLSEPRMGVAGYSKYQQATPNKDEVARQQNRRVEIFVLSPEARIAGFEPGQRKG